MEKKTAEVQKTQWLKSPLSEKSQTLQPMQCISLMPYYGSKKKLKIFRTHYLIGSSSEADIVIDDPFVSPRHAELVLNQKTGGYQISDLDSRNGVFVNGVRVLSAPLYSRGNLRIGRSSICWSSEEEVWESSDQWIFADPFMRQTVDRLNQMAKSQLPVLLLGETGTGKEILARLLHSNSMRKSGPYITVNGALTGGSLAESELFGHRKGAFTGAETIRIGALRSAHGGTLFLDEVADIPSSAQAKLLRALESGEVKSLGSDATEKADFRLVSATSHEIEGRISEGKFRLDLYYRLAGYVVRVPPLRERTADILAIARKNLNDSGLDLDKESEGKLLSYRWPGNIRELRSCIDRAIVIARAEGSSRVLPSHLVGLGEISVEEKVKRKSSTLAEMERQWIQSSLERNGWSRNISAKELGIARSTLFEKMKRFELQDRAVL